MKSELLMENQNIRSFSPTRTLVYNILLATTLDFIASIQRLSRLQLPVETKNRETLKFQFGPSEVGRTTFPSLSLVSLELLLSCKSRPGVIIENRQNRTKYSRNNFRNQLSVNFKVLNISINENYSAMPQLKINTSL